MNQPSISVIVPVYKAEGTLEKCARSILCQAPADLELILVDDGSPDGSGALCDRLAAQDGRVRVIHQKNSGASAARNAGLDAAAGRYLQFVDADDWVLPGLYETALPILENGADVLFFGVENIGYTPEPSLPDAAYKSLADLADQFERYLVTTGQFAAPYNKIYKAQVIGPVRFDPALKINEDLLFNLLALRRCGPVRFIPTNFYACDHTGEGSLSRSLRADLLDAEQATRAALLAFAAHYGLDEARAQALAAARQGNVAVAQMSVLMSRKGPLSLRGYRKAFARMLALPAARKALAAWLAADQNRLMALPYRICVGLRLAFPMALWCWLRCSTSHAL